MTKLSRMLIAFTGVILLLAGISLFFTGDKKPEPASPAESLAKVEKIETAREEPASIIPVVEAGGTGTLEEASGPATTEMEALIASVDITMEPRPVPELVEGRDFDLYVGVTAQYLLWFFDQIGYTGEKVDSGETTTVPRLIAVSIPKGWADDKSVQFKKSMFYRVMLPLILYENEAILMERARLKEFIRALKNRAPITPGEKDWINDLARKYLVLNKDEERELNEADFDNLLNRVDMVSPSLALGQAAYESGYATSRFAHTGNALFGQWDWSADRIRPEGQRAGKGDYGIKAFPYPVDSVRAYMWNLNTHYRYEDFRELRFQLRGKKDGQIPMDGIALAGTLTAYSERGAEYTEDLQGIMRFNRLERADQLRLLEGEPIYFD